MDHKSRKTASAHDLRRTFGQCLAELEIPIELTKAALGHRDQRTTEKFYVQMNAAKKSEQLSKYFNSERVFETVSETLDENEQSHKDVSPCGSKYSWVDAFRTSLCSNSQKIADFLRRFADLDLVA